MQKKLKKDQNLNEIETDKDVREKINKEEINKIDEEKKYLMN